MAACTGALQNPGRRYLVSHGPHPALLLRFGTRVRRACTQVGARYRQPAMPEAGIVTLFKIVGTLLGAMGVVPFLFLLAPGDRKEPNETFDGDVQ